MSEQRTQTVSKKSLPYIKRLVILLLPFLGAFIILATTNPYAAPLALIPLPFVLIGLGIYGIGFEIFKSFGLTVGKARAIAILISGSATLVMILKSIGQLGVRDFIIFMLLITGFVFYINRTKFKQ